jgi:gamma-glutamylcyclotransferase (GGCT)/AIG2-like uncharacterized protein YtfP
LPGKRRRKDDMENQEKPVAALFAYGTLMCEDIMETVAGRVPPSQKAVLHSYRRLVVENEEYPGLVPTEECQVEGILYHDVSSQSWERLDRFEGEMYCRSKVMVSLDDGSAVEAFVYIVRPEFRDRLGRRDWDFAGFVAKKKSVFVNSYRGYDTLE